MKRIVTIILTAALILTLAACGKVSDSTSVKAPGKESVKASEPVEETEDLYPGGIEEVSGVRIGLPDDSWTCEPNVMMGIGLFKAGCFYKNYPTIKIMFNDSSVDESIASSDGVYAAEPGSDFETEIGGYTFRGNRAVIEDFTFADSPTVMERLYYAISANRTLYIQLYVDNGGVKGVDRNDPDAQTIIRSIVDLNGYAIEENDPGENSADTNGDPIDSGVDALQAKWSLSGDGVLTIDCKLNFEGHANSYEYPWDKYSDKVNSVVITGKVTAIPNLAFSDFSALKKVVIPDTVERFGISCFKNCLSLEAVELPSAMNSAEYFIFSGCESLEEITVPGGLRHINNYNFSDCTSLKEATLCSGVESLGYDVFDGCTSLTTLYLPKSVTLIDLYSFRDTALKDVYYEGTKEDFAKIEIMDGNDPLTAAKIHYQSYNG